MHLQLLAAVLLETEYHSVHLISMLGYSTMDSDLQPILISVEVGSQVEGGVSNVIDGNGTRRVMGIEDARRLKEEEVEVNFEVEEV